MDYFEKIKAAFEKHGFDVEPPNLPVGMRFSNTTSMKVTHRQCGHQRLNGISTQKAEKKGFKICPMCHDIKEHRATWPHDVLAAKIKHDIGATLQGDKGSIYSRQPRERCLTSARVQCDKCGTTRDARIKILLRGKDNGCSVCSGNQTNHPSAVVERALKYGLKILNPGTYKGGSSILDFECDICGARFSKSWQNQRKRACGKCNRPFGEVLLEALCQYYISDGDWQSQYPVVALMEGSPSTTLYYDLASPKLKIVLENHSSYHKVGGESCFFGQTQEQLAERHRYDLIKEKAVAKPGSSISGWKYGVVWFELERLHSIEDTGGNYLPNAVKEFIEMMRECGHDLSSHIVPTMAEVQQFFSELNGLKKRAAAHDFTLTDVTWKGRTERYNFEHRCGCTSIAAPYEVEGEWRDCKTGCGWCDETGRLGEWRKFVELVATKGWHVENKTILRGEKETVEFTCAEHRQHGLQAAMRADLREECRKEAGNLPTCPGCRNDIQSLNLIEYKKRKVEEILVPFDKQLRAVGMTLSEWEWNGSARSDGSNVKYEISCLKCAHKRQVFLNATIAKLKTRQTKKTFCIKCKEIERT